MSNPPAPEQLAFDLVRFQADEHAQEFTLDITGETFWATGAEMAELFRVPEAVVTKQIEAVYAAGELTPTDTLRRSEERTGRSKGDQYNLDMILSVGYRVNSVKATAFRRWASRTLRALMVDGFVMDETRLRQDRGAAKSLAARLRAIRAEENNIYETVRSFLAAAAEDHDPEGGEAKAFVRRLEDTFVRAVTGQTAPRLLLGRADHARPGMGLHGPGERLPTMEEARIAQNYLEGDELFLMHLLCEQFLLMVEQRALRGQRMTVAELTNALDDLLRLDGYPVLPHHKAFHANKAVRHAQAEYARFIMRAGKNPSLR